MKLKPVCFYRKLAKKSLKQFNAVMDAVASIIKSSAECGYTKTFISLEDILQSINITVSDDKYSSLRNLVIRELEAKRFIYKVTEYNIAIYW